MLSIRRLTTPALAVLLAAVPALAQEPQLIKPSHAPAAGATAEQNQHLANAIARELKASGVLKNYRIDLTCIGGQVELCGLVADQGQRDEAVRLAHAVPGVANVKSSLSMASTGTIKQAQADQPLHAPQALPGEPVPSFRTGLPGGGAQQLAPPMPPYAWPTYAPHNNYSRVGYPEMYPYNAFPYIGPVHPFPKVPLGWRSVKLEWNDGHWWFSSHAQKRDWWSLRYW